MLVVIIKTASQVISSIVETPQGYGHSKDLAVLDVTPRAGHALPPVRILSAQLHHWEQWEFLDLKFFQEL